MCRHCKKPVDSIHYDSHVSICEEKKKEAALRKKERKEAKAREAAAKAKEDQLNSGDKDKDGDSTMGGGINMSASQDDGEKGSAYGDGPPATSSTKKPPKKSASKAQQSENASSKKTKKRKADDEAEKEPKKKKLKKDEPPKPKVAKPKGPVNVEIQCGVPLDKEKGGYCARSLTCKSHSMGLKRAVPGRSLPYDQLLAMYQKKNQAKQQKALIEAQVGAATAEEEAEGGAVDSEEEREAVMKGLSRWRPRPLEQVVTVPVGRRYGHVRLKEMLGMALAGSGGGRLFGVPAPGPVIGTEGLLNGGAGGSDASPATAAGTGGGGAAEGSRRPSAAGPGASGASAHAHPVPKGVAVPVRKGSVANSAGGA